MRTSQPGQSALLLLDAISVLKKLNIDYAVIGAMAASFYGAVRGSVDADAVLSLMTQSLKTLEDQFKRANFRTELRRGAPDDPIPALLALSDAHGNRVDLLIGIRGLDPDAFSRAVEAPFEEETLRMIGLEDFIAMKIFAGSPKDLEDARQAIAVSGKSISQPLVEKLSSRYGKSTLKALKALL
jgi:hypothetical protein